MFRRDQSGVSAGRTFHLGNSWVSLGGFIAREDVRKLKQLVEGVEQYINTAGDDDDEEELDTGAGLWDSIAQGAGIASQIANSPIGDAVAAYAPYGNLIKAAASGAPQAVQALQGKGLGPQAQTVAQLTSADPSTRNAALMRVRQMAALAQQNGPQAAKARADRAALQRAMLIHKDHEIAELRSLCGALRNRLLAYGDPIAYGEAAIDTSGPPALDQLRDALNRGLTRARVAPSPGFMRRPGRFG